MSSTAHKLDPPVGVEVDSGDPALEALPTRTASLDGLRLLGGLLVLAAHGGHFLVPLLGGFVLFNAMGVLGTGIFFALSGFLLTRAAIARPNVAARTRMRERLDRVLPGYALALVANAVLAFAVAPPAPLLPDMWAAPLYAVFAQNALSPMPNFFAESWNLPVLLAGAGLVALFIRLTEARVDVRSRAIRAARFFLLVLAVGISIRWLVAIRSDGHWDETLRKVVVTRIDALGYGGLAAAMYATNFMHRRWALLAVAAALAALAAAAGIAGEPVDATRHASLWLTVLGFALAAPLPALAAIRWASPPWLAALAQATWPMYLINMPLLYVVSRWLSPGESAAAGFTVWLLANGLALMVLLHLRRRRSGRGPE